MRRLLVSLLVLLTLIAVAALFVFLSRPLRETSKLQSSIVHYLESQGDFQLELSKIQFDWKTLTFQAPSLILRNRRQETLLEARNLYFKVGFQKRQVESVRIENAKIFVLLAPDKMLNWNLSGKDFWNSPKPLKIQIYHADLKYQDNTLVPSADFEFLDRKVEIEIQEKLRTFKISNTDFELGLMQEPGTEFVSAALRLIKQKSELMGQIEKRDLRFQGEAQVHQLNLTEAFSRKPPQYEHPTGSLTVGMSVGWEGLHPRLISDSLTGKGSLDIRQGAIQQINFIKEALNQLTPIPGFANILTEPFAPQIESTVHGDNTPFRILQADIQIFENRFQFSDVKLTGNGYFITAAGSAGMFTRDVDFSGEVILQPDMVESMAKSARALLYLQQPNGRIIIPVTWRGLLPGASVYVNLNHLTQHVIRSKAERLQAKGIHESSQLMEKL